MDSFTRSGHIDIIMVHYHAADLVRDAVAALQSDASGSGLAIGVFVVDGLREMARIAPAT